MSQQDNIAIIGAGPAGIAAGLALGQRAIVLDSRADVGGLSGTIELDGAIVDLGGHSFHTPHPSVRDLVFNALEMYEQQRDARCFTHGQLIPYPFQKHFHKIGNEQITQECEAGLEAVQSETVATNFEEHIRQRFGEGIAKHFLLPYNRKLWGNNLQRLAADWAGERVASATDSKEKFNTDDGKRKPLQSNTMVAYPSQGGFGEIMVALASRLSDLRLQKTVIGIDCQRRELHLSDGETLSWQQLISTMPIDKLLSLISDTPLSLIEDSQRLEKLSLALVIVVIGHSVDTPIQRIYSADDEQPAHKIAINHNSSPWLRTLPHHGIVAEVSYLDEKPLVESDLEARVVNGLQLAGIIKSLDEVRTTQTIKVPYAYPVPTHERNAIVQRIKTWLKDRGIHTLGRFGEWAYINSDEAIYRGLTLGESLKH